MDNENEIVEYGVQSMHELLGDDFTDNIPEIDDEELGTELALKNVSVLKENSSLADRIAVCTLISVLTVQGFSLMEISRKLGIKRRTVEYLRTTEEYKQILQSLTNEIVTTARTFLTSASLKAVRTLIECLDSPNDKVRLSASVEILNRVGLKTPEQIEVLSKGDAISKMDNDELLAMIKTGNDEILPLVKDEEEKDDE